MISENRIDKIINKYLNEKGILIQLLLDIQHEFKWIPKEAIKRISERLKIPYSQIFRVASFYAALSLTPIGRHLIQVTEEAQRQCDRHRDIVRGLRLLLQKGPQVPEG